MPGIILSQLGIKHQAVKRVAMAITLNRVSNQLPAGQRNISSPHGSWLCRRRRRWWKILRACRRPCGRRPLPPRHDIQVNVPGNNLICRVYNAYERPFNLLGNITHCLEQGPMGSLSRPFFILSLRMYISSIVGILALRLKRAVVVMLSFDHCTLYSEIL